MQYIIMFLIVLSLAFADFITGYIKARVQEKVSSKALRVGGLHKVSELTIMLAAIGLNIGLDKLGGYYSDTRLTSLAGVFTAVTVFIYIVVMELISIIENFAEITPEAAWARRVIERLRKYEEGEDNDKNDT